MRKSKPTLKKITYLDYACKIGEEVQWNTINGNHYEGVLIEWKENELAVIKLKDNSIMEVQC